MGLSGVLQQVVIFWSYLILNQPSYSKNKDFLSENLNSEFLFSKKLSLFIFLSLTLSVSVLFHFKFQLHFDKQTKQNLETNFDVRIICKETSVKRTKKKFQEIFEIL